MRNLILLILKFSNFLLFIGLQIICIVLIIRFNPYQRSSFFSSSNSVVGSLNETGTNFVDYVDLKKVNDSLAVENQQLRNFLDASFYYNQVKIDTKCKAHFDQSYTYQNAKVIQNSFTKSANYITLNRGSNHGVKVNNGVVGPNGIVGIITNTSDNYSLAMSFLNKRFSTSGKIKGSDYFGPIVWEGINIKKALLTNIPDYAELNIGDSIISTGYSHIFPEGIMIGEIEEFNKKKGAPFYDVNVSLSSNFAKLNYVYIVDHLFADELKNLELEVK